MPGKKISIGKSKNLFTFIQASPLTIIGFTKYSLEKKNNTYYAMNMTLADRNMVFKAGIAFSFVCMVICIIGSIKAFPAYSLMENGITHRAGGVLNFFTTKFFAVKLTAVHACILALVLYSVFSMFFIHYFFEKTQSPEILFVGLFAVSFSLETLRLIIPLMNVYEIPSFYALAASRINLFGRYFGIFSLFVASVYAVGFEAQRQHYVIIILIATTLIVALGVPIDTQTWDSSLNMINGYVSMFRIIEAGTFLITTISFLIAAWTRGSREFAFIGVGSVLVFLGRNILLTADTWAGPPLGILFLTVGTALICTKLHKFYLWL
jgi:hypothetical protein